MCLLSILAKIHQVDLKQRSVNHRHENALTGLAAFHPAPLAKDIVLHSGHTTLSGFSRRRIEQQKIATAQHELTQDSGRADFPAALEGARRGGQLVEQTQGTRLLA